MEIAVRMVNGRLEIKVENASVDTDYDIYVKYGGDDVYKGHVKGSTIQKGDK